ARGSRRLAVFAELFDLLPSHRQTNRPLADLGHLLRWDVARLAKHAGSDREPVEDVSAAVADHLVDLADLTPVGGQDLPAGFDHHPGDRISHRVGSLTHPGACRPGPAPRKGPHESSGSRSLSSKTHAASTPPTRRAAPAAAATAPPGIRPTSSEPSTSAPSAEASNSMRSSTSWSAAASQSSMFMLTWTSPARGRSSP